MKEKPPIISRAQVWYADDGRFGVAVAQRDADVAWCEPIVEQAKAEVAREIMEKLQDRLKMTCDGYMEILFTQVDWQSLKDKWLKGSK